MTAFLASLVGFADRGRLEVGLACDMVVVDPATVADRATFTETFQDPVGIEGVFGNEVPALTDGVQGDRKTARAVRRIV